MFALKNIAIMRPQTSIISYDIMLYDIMVDMNFDVKSAIADIESTPDLLERAMKLSGLIRQEVENA